LLYRNMFSAIFHHRGQKSRSRVCLLDWVQTVSSECRGVGTARQLPPREALRCGLRSSLPSSGSAISCFTITADPESRRLPSSKGPKSGIQPLMCGSWYARCEGGRYRDWHCSLLTSVWTGNCTRYHPRHSHLYLVLSLLTFHSSKHNQDSATIATCHPI
jgi:hypothetical protein